MEENNVDIDHIKNKFLDFTRNKIHKNTKVCVAFSGGIDSLAMLLLTKLLSQLITAITIDHDLRIDSYTDALKCRDICNTLNIHHEIIKWERKSISGNIQAAAKQARYEMLLGYCNKYDMEYLLTGHTLDDDVENFFIKLSRSSGIFGLGRIKDRNFNGVTILRPMRDITKHECRTYVNKHGIDHVEDPTNAKDCYFRNQIRKIIENQPDPELFKKRIIKSQNNLEEAYLYVKAKVLENISKIWVDQYYGFALIDMEKIDNAHIIFHRVLSYILTIIGGKVMMPCGKPVDRIISLFQETHMQQTLHGCCIVKRANMVLLYRDFGKFKPQTLIIKSVNKEIWDNRFTVYSFADNATEVAIDIMIKKHLHLYPTEPLIPSIFKDFKEKILMAMPIFNVNNEARKPELKFTPVFVL